MEKQNHNQPQKVDVFSLFRDLYKNGTTKLSNHFINDENENENK